MDAKSVVLLSAGLDSTVNLYRAHKDNDIALVLTLDYGQRAALSEIRCSKRTCQRLGLKHQVLSLPWFKDFTRTSLVNREEAVPENVRIDDLSASEESAEKVWVPNRNGIMINIAAGFAEGIGASSVIVGFNKEEAMTFPDNTGEFIEAANGALFYSTANHVRVKCYTSNLIKPEIYQLGRDLSVDFDHVWPCYFDGEEICGRCESCLRFLRARKVSLNLKK